VTKNTRHFARLYNDVVDSEPIVSASSGATRLLVLLMRRRNGHNEISCSVREAAKWCHCSKATALRHFRELQSLGVIEPLRRGYFDIKAGDLKAVATTWRLKIEI
jgi:DNA-binding IclR family transcriptional regulator